MEEEDISTKRQSPAAMDSKASAKGKVETPDSQPKVKKKRRSPAVPWKKPKDMPKRPLSAYNLFFKEERERILSAGPMSTEGVGLPAGDGDEEPEGLDSSEKSRSDTKHGKTSGVGFSNLTKKIAIRWQQLDKEGRAPYEKRAAKDKKRYDEAVLVWRTKKKEDKKQAEKEAEDLLRARVQPAPMASDEVESLPLEGLFDDSYPSTWFEAHDGVSGVESDFNVLPTQGTAMRDEPHPMHSPPRLHRPLIPPQQLVHMFQNVPLSELQGSSGTFPESNIDVPFTRQQFVPTRTMQSLFLPTDMDGTASTLGSGSGSLQYQAAEPNPRRDLFLDPFMQTQIGDVHIGDVRSTDYIQQSPSTRTAVRESFERLVEELDNETIAFMTSLRFP
jgi:hypothetical protein